MGKTYRYYPYYFALFLVGIVACFFQSYFGHIPRFENVISPIGNVPITITGVTHFHAIMLTVWLLMLVVQPVLILRKKLAWHRLLGKVSYGVIGLIVVSLLLIIYQEQTREKNLPVLAASLFDVPTFLGFYGLAIYYRKKPAYHARFMLMSVLPFLDPALARLNLPGVFVQWGFWVAFFGFEFFNRKLYRPWLIGLGYYALNLANLIYLTMVNQPMLDRIWHLFFS
ncbi:MAG: hypothetical protein EAZ91_21760 [Cytophagales bacterium]|nr:MAG: hypothetical protein EAZ91_21760 [Cytophagales bacterium]